jgi:4-amino-4-deoxy-L-arabinose transferase-like glycosyltransferase
MIPWWSIVLCAVMLLGAGLRLYDLSLNSPELFSDELELYVSAQSIAATGRDVDGELHLFLYSRLTRNPPIYGAAALASTLVFGKTPLGIRLPAALFGLVSIAMLYGIVLELTRRQGTALLAALFLAIQPWFVHFSRTGWEPAAELPFLLGALYALLRTLRATQEGKPLSHRGLLASALLFGLAPYTYMAAWFYAACFGGSLLALHVRQCARRENQVAFLATLLLSLLIATPALWFLLFDPYTSARGYSIATFAPGLSLANLHVFAVNYIAHFGWPFLFASGDDNPRYLSGTGELFWWTAPLALVGTIFAWRYVRPRPLLVWVSLWLLMFPLAGALTNDGVPHAARTLAGAPIFCVLSAIGLTTLSDFRKHFASSKLGNYYDAVQYLLLVFAVCSSLRAFCTFYFHVYPRSSASAWDSGTRATFAFARAHTKGHVRVCFGGFDYYHIDTLVRYYLDGVPLRVIEDSDDAGGADCSKPATLLVRTGDSKARFGFRRIAVIEGADESPFAVVEERPMLGARATKTTDR